MGNQKRIALVANTSWNIYNFRRPFVDALVMQGWQVFILAPENHYSQKLIGLRDIKYIPLKQLKNFSVNPIDEYLFYKELVSKYRHLKLDLVFHFTIKPNIYGVLAASKLGIPSIATVTGLGYTFNSTKSILWITKWLYKKAFSKAQAVIFENKDDQRLFKELNLLNDETSYTTSGPGIQIDDYKNSKINIDKDNFTFLFVGRILISKGIIEYLECAKLLKLKYGSKINFDIIGSYDSHNPDVPKLKVFESYIKDGIVNYYGEVDNVNHYLKKSNVVVLPSYREGVPRALLEAMAMSLPIVTTDVPGCRQTVDQGKNGLLVEAKSTKSLVKSCEELYLMPIESLTEMGKEGRKKVENEFSMDLIIKQYFKIIQNIR